MSGSELYEGAIAMLAQKMSAVEVFKTEELRRIAKEQMSAANRAAFEQENPQRMIKIRLPNQYKSK